MGREEPPIRLWGPSGVAITENYGVSTDDPRNAHSNSRGLVCTVPSAVHFAIYQSTVTLKSHKTVEQLNCKSPGCELQK